MLKKQAFLLYCLVACAALSAACVKHNQGETGPGSPSSVVESMLARAVKESRSDLGMLARARGGGETPPKLPPADASLSRELTMSWVGPADTAVRELCRQTDYTFEENGRRRVQYPSVTFSVVNRAAYYILEDLAWQVRPQFVLQVDTTRRTITLSGAGGTGADPFADTAAKPAKKKRGGK
jgi:hypothetical protein